VQLAASLIAPLRTAVIALAPSGGEALRLSTVCPSLQTMQAT
jgi:hypothetical protein